MHFLGLHGRPVEGTRVNGLVVVIIMEGPVEHHGGVVESAVSADDALEVFTDIVTGGVGIGVDHGRRSLETTGRGGVGHDGDVGAVGFDVSPSRGVVVIVKRGCIGVISCTQGASREVEVAAEAGA